MVVKYLDVFNWNFVFRKILRESVKVHVTRDHINSHKISFYPTKTATLFECAMKHILLTSSTPNGNFTNLEENATVTFMLETLKLDTRLYCLMNILQSIAETVIFFKMCDNFKWIVGILNGIIFCQMLTVSNGQVFFSSHLFFITIWY